MTRQHVAESVKRWLKRTMTTIGAVVTVVALFAIIGHSFSDGANVRTSVLLGAIFFLGLGTLFLCGTQVYQWQRATGALLISIGTLILTICATALV